MSWRAGVIVAGVLFLTAGGIDRCEGWIGAANATTVECGNLPHCFSILSHQARPLEIATGVPASQVHAGTRLVGMTPSFRHAGRAHYTTVQPDHGARWRQ
jgi:hypothetical protein